MSASATFTVDCARQLGELPRLWNSTGFTPANLLLRPAMRQVLQWYGAVPEGGLRHCRIHLLLDLVTAKGLETGGEAIYDFSRLDRGLDQLVGAGIAPFFELMGDPTNPRVEPLEQAHYGNARKGRSRGFFTDFTDARQKAAWQRLVRDVARHCIARYGREEVLGWHWEVWNEPDISWWPQGVPQLLAYTEACVAGLAEADPELTFGGPGTCRTMSEPLHQWLAHVDAQGLDLDFVSIHEKGTSAHPEQIAIDTPGIVRRTRELAAHLRSKHPRLARLPLYNDECDPIVGWHHVHSYHAMPWYAAWALRVIDLHLRTLVDEDGVDLRLLGNDHGFIGTWGMRSLLACIDLVPRGDSFPHKPDHEQGRFLLVKKPIYNFHVLAALLGAQRLASTATGNPDCGVLGTIQDGVVAVAYYHHRDRPDHGGFSVPGRLRIANLPPGTWRMVHERIDEGAEHPFAVFAAGPCDPPEPETQRRYLQCGEPRRLGAPGDVQGGGTLELDLDLPLPGMGLVLLVRDPGAPPAQVEGLAGEHWPGISDDEQIMLRWRHLPNRTLWTYEVERSDGGSWCRINPDTRCAAWCDLRQPLAGGAAYRVRAVDLWGRAGAWSAELRT